MKNYITAVCFLLVLVVAVFAQMGAEGRRRYIRGQLRRFVSGRAEQPSPQNAAGDRRQLPIQALRRRVTNRIAKMVDGRPQAEALGLLLRQAGWKMQASEFIIISVCCSLVTLAIATLIIADVPVRILVGIAAYWLPRLGLNRQIAARRKTIETQLVDTLSMIANALRSGYSFLQAMEVAARELPEPIAGELDQVLRECRVNIGVEQALTNLITRTGSADLDLTVTAILIQRQVGGNLGEVLDNISVTIRERLRARGEIRTLTAQGRISALIITLLPVALTVMIYLINPAYMRPLFTSPIGLIIMATAVLMNGVGIFLISRIVKIEL